VLKEALLHGIELRVESSLLKKLLHQLRTCWCVSMVMGAKVANLRLRFLVFEVVASRSSFYGSCSGIPREKASIRTFHRKEAD
jgi:hypothetical protein